MKIRNLEFYGFGPAIRGMRNSFASWWKQSEWHYFCETMLHSLPYLKEIMDV